MLLKSITAGPAYLSWFSRGATILRSEIAALESDDHELDKKKERDGESFEKRKKLADTLYGIIEVYITDLF